MIPSSEFSFLFLFYHSVLTLTNILIQTSLPPPNILYLGSSLVHSSSKIHLSITPPQLLVSHILNIHYPLLTFNSSFKNRSLWHTTPQHHITKPLPCRWQCPPNLLITTNLQLAAPTLSPRQKLLTPLPRAPALAILQLPAHMPEVQAANMTAPAQQTALTCMSTCKIALPPLLIPFLLIAVWQPKHNRKYSTSFSVYERRHQISISIRP